MSELVSIALFALPGASTPCTLEPERRGREISALAAQCENADAQPFADALLDRVATPFPRGGEDLPGVIELVPVGGGWDIASPVRLAGIDYSRWRGAGRYQRDCAGTARIEADGAITAAEWICDVVNWRGREGDDVRPAERLADLASQTRWLLPLRHETGCLESSIYSAKMTGQDLIEHPRPAIDADARPTCDDYQFSAVYFDHPLTLPPAAAPMAVGAVCVVRYDYDSEGFIHDAVADCGLRNTFGHPIENDGSVAYGKMRDAFETGVLTHISRTRRAPSDEPFDGRRESVREIEFDWDSMRH